MLNIMLVARAKGKFEKVQSGTRQGVNWLRLAILSITAVAVGVDFHYHGNKLDALSFGSALLAIVVLVWSLFTKSRRSQPRA
jgi:membrane protein YdbS with pleckstrin-like domain